MTPSALTKLYEALGDLSPNDQLLIEKAFQRAEAAHAGQKRKSGEPYFIHPIAVAQILAEMKLDAESVAAGLLHDVVEDCDITVSELRQEFGKGVATIVDGVSKLKNLVDNKAKTGASDNITKQKLEQVTMSLNISEKCSLPWVMMYE